MSLRMLARCVAPDARSITAPSTPSTPFAAPRPARADVRRGRSSTVLAAVLARLLATVLLAGCAPDPESPATPTSETTAMDRIPAPTYPESRRSEVVEAFRSARDGEVEIADPWRWLETDVRESEEVAEWVAAQNAVTFDYLENLPGRDRLAARLTELFDYERFSLPVARGGRYFYSRNDGLQDQAVYLVQDGPDAEPEVLLDPNGWSEDGTVALAGAVPSPDGTQVAYLVQDGGSDWRTIRVVDVDDGSVHADELQWVKFSGLSWAKDGSGFYYSRYPEPDEGTRFTATNLGQAVHFHRLGDPQEADVRVFADPGRPEVGWDAQVSDDGDHLVVRSWVGTDGGGLQVLSLTDPDAEPVVIFDDFEFNHDYVGNFGDRFFLLTDAGAPNKRVVAVDLSAPRRLVDVIPESGAPIESADHVGGHFFVTRLRDVSSEVSVHDEDFREIRTVDLPGLGTAQGFGGEPDDGETFYSFSSFDRPPTLYRYAVDSGATEVFRAPETTFDPEDYVVEQHFFDSTGGARVPMFIVHRRDLTPTFGGPHPTVLYGYGGFGIALTPGFSVSRLAWLELGGVFAVANLRGGAEYGRDWHDAGRLERKQNVFDDFANAAEALIELGWASPDTLAVQGGSNGGLLVGAVANQRPELFAAALPAVGVMDMLRFDEFTAGRFWVDDYGSPDDPAMFDVLRAYSPLHNIPRTDAYPATLVTTADTDDRVVPGHSFKFAAALQAADTGNAPTLIRVETRAGHGAGTPISKIVAETADEWAFVARHTGLDLSGE